MAARRVPCPARVEHGHSRVASVDGSPTVVRISKGPFDARRAADVERLLRESEAALRATLSGLVADHVGLDVAANAMTDTSRWSTRADATRTVSLPAMQAPRIRFEALGVRFEEVTSREVRWSAWRSRS